MYVCGPTVYGPPHLGHGRFSLVFDVLRRYLEWTGLEVTYVSNITDIDDNILKRADAEGRPWTEIAERCEAVWYRAHGRHRRQAARRTTRTPPPTSSRWSRSSGGWSTPASPTRRATACTSRPSGSTDYGLLARQSIDSLRAGARVEANEEKRSPVDFVLWKKAKPGEPSWPSPWGDGPARAGTPSAS